MPVLGRGAPNLVGGALDVATANIDSLKVGGLSMGNAKGGLTPQSWNANWANALLNSPNAPAGILFAGDSITQGYGATDFLNLGYKGLLRSALISQPGQSLHADFLATYESDDFVNAYTGGGVFPWKGTPPWVIVVNPGGGARVYAMVGLTLTLQWPGTINAPTTMATFTPPYNSNAMDIIYWNLGAGGGTWNYNIDGGATQTVTHSGTAGLARVQLRSLGPGNHVIRIIGQSASNVATVNGITCYNTQTGNPPAGGLWFAHLAYGGATISAYGKTTTGNPTDHLALFSNSAGIGPPLGKNLIINAFIAGDAVVDGVGARNGLDHFQYNQRRFLQACRQANPNCSQIFVVPQIADSYYSDSTTAAIGLSQNYHLWVARKLQIAQEELCAVVDMQSLFGQTPVASGLQVSVSDIHPTNAGHALIAQTVLPVLLQGA